jgi:cell division protein FtsZ
MSPPADGPLAVAVVALGGGAGNALNHILRAGLAGVTAVAANTDAQDLRRSRADVKVLLGREVTKGLGANADPETGAQAAMASTDELSAALVGARLVIVLASLGGGTGSGAAPVVVQLARELGAATLPIVALPFAFEGRRRRRQADEALAAVAAANEGVAVVSHAGVLLDPGMRLMTEAFDEVNDAMACAVRDLLATVAGGEEQSLLERAVAGWAATWTPRCSTGTVSAQR